MVAEAMDFKGEIKVGGWVTVLSIRSSIFEVWTKPNSIIGNCMYLKNMHTIYYKILIYFEKYFMSIFKFVRGNFNFVGNTTLVINSLVPRPTTFSVAHLSFNRKWRGPGNEAKLSTLHLFMNCLLFAV